nr:MAG TPA: hypothetical protein [Caudoviricetes sp.]
MRSERTDVCFFIPPCCGITPLFCPETPSDALRRFPITVISPATNSRSCAHPCPAVAVYRLFGRNAKKERTVNPCAPRTGLPLCVVPPSIPLSAVPVLQWSL